MKTVPSTGAGQVISALPERSLPATHPRFVALATS